MNDDLMLLKQFADENSESAFAEIVSRHINLVYSVAWRQVRDAHLAEEVVQAVFIILSRKAKSFDHRTILSGWLCRTARYASANALTMQRRRQLREQEAFMQNTLNENATDPELQETWSRIAPLLDTALEKLAGKDHDALVLRFFENKSFAEVGAALEVSESAAKMRVNRALEKLRKIFAKHGVSSTTAVLAGIISVNSIQAAPVTLAKSVTAVAVTKGAVASSSTLTLIKGALKIMAWTKAKITIAVSAGLLLAVGGGTVIYQIAQAAPKTRAASLPANEPANLKINWLTGKKYSMVMEVNQSTETSVPGQAQPVKTVTSIRQDFEISPLQKLPDEGWNLQFRVMDVALDLAQNGGKVLSFDSNDNSPMDPNNPAGLLRLIIGAPLQFRVDANSAVLRVDGMDQIMKRVDAGKPQQQLLFRQLFGGDLLKQYVSFGSWVPNHSVNVGGSWAVKKDINTVAGDLTLDMKFAFQNWEQHADRRCAHLKMTGRVSTKSVSTASGAAIQVEKGEITGDIWFDPDLGMVVESNGDQRIALKVSTQAQTVSPQMNERTHYALVDVE